MNNAMSPAEQLVTLARLAESLPEIAYVLRYCGLATAAKLYLGASS
jgi:hypothetical protein